MDIHVGIYKHSNSILFEYDIIHFGPNKLIRMETKRFHTN